MGPDKDGKVFSKLCSIDVAVAIALADDEGPVSSASSSSAPLSMSLSVLRSSSSASSGFAAWMLPIVTLVMGASSSMKEKIEI